MPTMRFTVLGAPVPQPRQRHRHVQTKDGREFTMNFTGRRDPVQQFKADIKMAAAQAASLPPQLITGPVTIECQFFLPRPARLMRRKDPDGPVAHTGRPDLDNLVKAVKDALRGVVWKDDAQVFRYGTPHDYGKGDAWLPQFGGTGKWFHEKAGRPRTEIRIDYGPPDA